MRWRRSNPALSVLALLSGIFVASPVSRAQAPPPAPLEGATPDLNASVRDLQLEVFINGSSTHLVGAFRQIRDGCLVANPDEVHDIGLKPAREALDADGLIHLDRLKGVSYRVQESTQRLYVTAPNEALVPHLIDVSPKPADDMPEPQRGLGGLLNYTTLFANSDGLSWSNLYDYRGLSGTFDAHMFTPYGTFSQSVIAGSASDDREKVTRLETTWTYSDPRELITYRAGDMISGGLSWTRPVWLGGVQVQRNFALRPDLVTLPIPALSGSAAVPSTLDVYAQDVRTFSGEVPAGPFQVTNLPVITGAGTARVVLHDALGRETVTTLPFYASSQLLREGLYGLLSGGRLGTPDLWNRIKRL